MILKLKEQKDKIGNNCSYALPSVLFLLFVCLLVALSGFATKRVALPKQYVENAEIPGMPGVKDWGDQHSEVFQEDLILSIKKYIDSKPENHKYENDTINILAISGGGPDGAFTAGFINGWDASGTRPTFNLVTGVSAGSLIAPFVFLGGKYDKLIGKITTSLETNDIFTSRSTLSILWGANSIADSTPLADLIAMYVNEDMLKDIATAHSMGRRLFIGTTNLDASRLVIWNMGVIASSGHPDALELFRKIMRASASIPILFQPILIEVKANGNTYDETHVDGGVVVDVFFYGELVNTKAAYEAVGIKKKPRERLFIIGTSQVQSNYEPVKQNLISIGIKALMSRIRSQGIGDLYRIYATTKGENIDYNLAPIPPDWVPNSKQPFDPDYLKRLYDLGYNLAKSGYSWQKHPPYYEQINKRS